MEAYHQSRLPTVGEIAQLMKSIEEQMVSEDEDVDIDDVRESTATAIRSLMEGGE